MNQADVLAYMRQHAPGACPIVAGSAGTDELTPGLGVDGSDLEIAVVGWLGALRMARRVRRNYPDVETYFVAPWRMRWGLQRNLGVPRPNLPAFDLARQKRAGPLPWGSTPPRVWNATELTAREAMTLIGNRIAVHLDKQTPYTAVKLAVATGDAVLVSMGTYELGYARRKAQFSKIASSLPSTLATTATRGYEAKLTGQLPQLNAAELAAAVTESFTVVSKTLSHFPADDAGSMIERSVSDRVRLAWEEDARAARWGRVLVLAETVFTVLRGRKHLGVGGSVRLALRTGSVEAAIYANLIARLIGCHVEGDGVASSWTLPDEHLLRLWRAYCA
jgi:hypothetical protein